MGPLREWWKDHSLTVVVAVAQATLFGGVVWAYWPEWHEAAKALSVSLFGEVCAIQAIVWLTKSLRERGSPESGDDD